MVLPSLPGCSDWGTSISTSLAQQDAEHGAGIHLTQPIAPPDPATFDDLTDAERAALRKDSFAPVSAWFTHEVTDTVRVPTGCSIFPRETPHPSRRWAARR